MTKGSSFRKLFYLPLLSIGILFAPDVCLSQQRPLSADDIVELVRGEVDPGEIVNIARPRCISFRVNGAAEATLRDAGANDQLIQGLRVVCYRALGYSTTRAAVSSFLLPGLGQFYTGRPLPGVLLASAFGGALAFGVLSESTTIECLGVVSGDSCQGNALSTTVERPYLLPGVGMAVAVAVVGALDAARGARRANERANQVAVAGDGGPVQSDRPRLVMPAVLPRPDGVAVEILRLRF